jgi:hypothetical protein
MQMALEALELYQSKSSVQMFDDAVKALRQALETEQEPVATVTSESGNPNLSMSWWHEPALPVGTKIYTSPPKREWVGLTDEEIDALSQAPSLTDELMDCVDRLGSEADTVDPRVWQHLLVYAPKPEEEPVAWMHNFIEGNVITHRPADIGRHPERWTPLYTAPCQTCQSLAMAVMNDQTYHEKVIPKREWVGLTDEEVSEIIDREIGFNSCWGPEEKFARAIEQALKEKNT